MNEFEKSKTWSDSFIPEIKRSLGETFIKIAPFKDDTEYNTDLIMPNGDRISCRVRIYGYWRKYRSQFTIRTDRPSGVKSEFEKVLEGHGDYIFYGFSNPDGTGLVQWFVGDLKVFRYYIADYMAQNHGELPGIERINPDGSSLFRAFKCKDIPGFIVDSFTL